MLPHYYWMRPDPEGLQRRANEARAAVMYQAWRRFARMVTDAPGFILDRRRDQSAARPPLATGCAEGAQLPPGGGPHSRWD